MGHALVFMISEVKTTTKLSEAAYDGVTTGYLVSLSEFQYCACGTCRRRPQPQPVAGLWSFESDNTCRIEHENIFQQYRNIRTHTKSTTIGKAEKRRKLRRMLVSLFRGTYPEDHEKVCARTGHWSPPSPGTYLCSFSALSWRVRHSAARVCQDLLQRWTMRRRPRDMI